MIFDRPVPFEQALQSQAVKAILPTEASSAELARIAPALRERARFSARVTNYRFLEHIDQAVNRMISPETIIDPMTGDRRPARPGEAMDAATFRVQARELLDAIGYQPKPDEEGKITDLRSTIRLNTIIETNTKMARGYGNWAQGQDPAILDQWPAQEFFRQEARGAERDWPPRWIAAGGSLSGNRMIALKNSPVWTRLSVFGLPYPPFDYNSGMGVRDIDRDEAIELNLIDRDVQVQPQTRDFNEDLELDISPEQRQSNLFASLLKTLGDTAEMTTEGALRFK